jgi:hypothetical protein
MANTPDNNVRTENIRFFIFLMILNVSNDKNTTLHWHPEDASRFPGNSGNTRNRHNRLSASIPYPDTAENGFPTPP